MRPAGGLSRDAKTQRRSSRFAGRARRPRYAIFRNSRGFFGVSREWICPARTSGPGDVTRTDETQAVPAYIRTTRERSSSATCMARACVCRGLTLTALTRAIDLASTRHIQTDQTPQPPPPRTPFAAQSRPRPSCHAARSRERAGRRGRRTRRRRRQRAAAPPR